MVLETRENMWWGAQIYQFTHKVKYNIFLSKLKEVKRIELLIVKEIIAFINFQENVVSDLIPHLSPADQGLPLLPPPDHRNWLVDFRCLVVAMVKIHWLLLENGQLWIKYSYIFIVQTWGHDYSSRTEYVFVLWN